MAKTHYDTLGISRKATTEELRSAYRKIVLVHHPDRSSDPASKPIFFAATEAYEILSDPEARRRYDGLIDLELRKEAEDRASRRARDAARPPSSNSQRPSPTSSTNPRPRPTSTNFATSNAGPATSRTAPPNQSATSAPPKSAPSELSVAEEIQRLTKLFQTGRHNEAEIKARAILRRDGRQPVPYAVLGDIARSRGNVNESAKMYAYAMQMDPSNQLYEKRYADILSHSRVVNDSHRTRLETPDQQVLVPAVGGVLVLILAIYMAAVRETPAFGFLPPISSWTLSSVVIIFISGVITGASLSLGNLLDRFGAVSTNSSGKIAPTMALGCVSVIWFWAAAVIYGLVGLSQRSWNYSTTRLVGSVAGLTVLLTVAAALNTYLKWDQMLIWSGNLAYLGALCGWMVADTVR